MRAAFFLLLGASWHVVVVALSGRRVVEAFDWGMLAGCAAGVVAGYFTLWSRRRLRGRDNFWLVVATYYLAILSYWLAGAIMYVSSRAGVRPWDRQLASIGSDLGWLLAYGTLFSIVLLPLCWGTRWLAWRCGGIVRPNKA